MFRSYAALGPLCLALVACGGPNPVDANAAAASSLPDVAARAPTATGEPHVKTTPESAEPASTPAAAIPAGLQGRWGLTPEDCTTSRGDAKGLIVIDKSKVRFYESRAIPAANVGTGSNSISGTFAFTGEGQSWTKYESLKANGNTLVRTEIDPEASFTYAKCV